MPNYTFEPRQFTVRLPKAYYEQSLDLALAADIFSFEVNALPVEGRFELQLTFCPEVESAALSLDRETFEELTLHAGAATLPVTVDHCLLSFEVRVAGAAPGLETPLREVRLVDPAAPDRDPEPFTRYSRDTKLSNCNLLENWPEAHDRIMSETFDLHELTVMRDEIVAWVASRQVLDRNDPHAGAAYSEEDKYCFKDAIFAACCFMRKYLETGKAQWLDRATAARDYCFKGQYRNTGDLGKDGCWASMGIIDDKRGKLFRRITDAWALGSGVDTALIGLQCEHLQSMGMAFTEAHLEQLCGGVDWNLRNMVKPGWFSHHEDMDLLCLNMNSLGASLFYAVHRMLCDTGHPGLADVVLKEADAGIEHVLRCQEAIGVYPYRPYESSLSRGGSYSLENLPDNGIGMQALVQTLRNPFYRLGFEDLGEHLRRTALWYLLCSRFEDGHLMLEVSREPGYLQGVAFGNFTWCRITMLDILSQVWDHIGNSAFWKQFCLCQVRTLREVLWNTENPGTAPIKRSAVPGVDLSVVSWIQQAEWAAFVFDNLARRYGVNETAKDER